MLLVLINFTMLNDVFILFVFCFFHILVGRIGYAFNAVYACYLLKSNKKVLDTEVHLLGFIYISTDQIGKRFLSYSVDSCVPPIVSKAHYSL